MRGKFIVIEGNEGAGKSSVVEYLKTYLPEGTVHFTREPGGTKMAEEIRTVLLASREETVYPETELMLFCAARAQHVRNVIIPKLEAGIHVVSDRFAAGTFAYQVFGPEREDLLEYTRGLHAQTVGDLTPDLALLMRVPAELGLQRNDHVAGKKNRMEEKGLEYHMRVAEGFRRIMPELYGSVVQEIDATMSLHEVKAEALRLVREVVGV